MLRSLNVIMILWIKMKYNFMLDKCVSVATWKTGNAITLAFEEVREQHEYVLYWELSMAIFLIITFTHPAKVDS